MQVYVKKEKGQHSHVGHEGVQMATEIERCVQGEKLLGIKAVPDIHWQECKSN